MRLTGLQILLSLAATALGASDVVDLTASTFDKHIQSHDIVLAEFFAPWCGHCKTLAPEYEEAATSLKKRSEDISLAKIDCTENQSLCQEQGVSGFPTLFIFEGGEKTGQYQGPRKADDISKFLVKRSLPAVTDVKDGSGVQSWISKNKDENNVVFLYLGPSKSYDSFANSARAFRERNAFISASDEKLREKYNNADIVVFKLTENSEDPVAGMPSGSELTDASITEFIKANEFPSFGELGPETYSAYIENGTPMMYAFVTSDEQRDLVKSSVTPHLELLNGKANVVFLNASIYAMHASNVNIRQEFPAMVVHDVKSNKKYVHDQDIPLSQESIAKFVKQYTAGEIEPHVKSEPVPETQDEPVYVLVGSQYDNVVLDNDKDVLVEYYAPWCGHCNNLKPIYEELGEYYAGDDSVVIAKLDHTVNEVPDQISGYPTIKFYPAGKKDSPVDYEGSRTLESFIEFVNENRATSAKAEKATKDSKKAAKVDSKDEL